MGFRVLGFRVSELWVEFWAWGFKVEGFGFRLWVAAELWTLKRGSAPFVGS